MIRIRQQRQTYDKQYLLKNLNGDIVVIMAALWNRAGHYILPSSSLLFFLAYSQRLDVYHTSTYGVALVRI